MSVDHENEPVMQLSELSVTQHHISGEMSAMIWIFRNNSTVVFGRLRRLAFASAIGQRLVQPATLDADDFAKSPTAFISADVSKRHPLSGIEQIKSSLQIEHDAKIMLIKE